MYICERCGYETEYKQSLVRHLMRAKECGANLCSIDREVLIRKLVQDRKSKTMHQCTYCNAEFTFKSNMYRHQKCCPQRPEIKESTDVKELTELKEVVKDLSRQLEDIKQHNRTGSWHTVNNYGNKERLQLLLELQYYKNRRTENFYQLMLEQHLQGTHKTLECGITDVTTETCHAEIKEWKNWKEAVGQLTCYNAVDPKQELALYMFGKYAESCKERVVKIAKGFLFKVFEFKECPQGNVFIEDYVTKEQVFTYMPNCA